jgi:hypothetical protein
MKEKFQNGLMKRAWRTLTLGGAVLDFRGRPQIYLGTLICRYACLQLLFVALEG